MFDKSDIMQAPAAYIRGARTGFRPKLRQSGGIGKAGQAKGRFQKAKKVSPRV
ncbi:MAG: hypothetical protein IPL88_06735 [Rhizobiales bacterium]|nr:hypothetical protein [Hyphomicrobiales bacterium]